MEHEITASNNSEIPAGETAGGIPKGIKITAILLIVLCGFQLIVWNAMLVVASERLGTNLADFVIYSSMIFGSILPFMGVTAGVGILLLKGWGRTMAIVFSVLALMLYGTAISMALYTDNTWRQSAHLILFPFGYLLGLPIWTLYYLTRKQIKLAFSKRDSNQTVTKEGL